MVDAIDCQDHQTQITHQDISAAAFGLKLMRNVHSVSSFYNYGTHRLRLALCVRPVLIDIVKFCKGEPCTQDADYAKEMAEFLIHWS